MPAPFGLPVELAELRDDYDVLGELGRGGAAVVYRARDRALGREVAVKVVHPRPTSPDDDPVARLAREARMVAQLQHPHIVAVYAVRRLRGGGLALIMRLVSGGTLKTAVQTGGPLPPDRVESVLRDVAAALAYAHARGLVHRDVKPENIFLDEDSGAALLADFGIARSTESDSMTLTGTAIGTPFYMSPEQVDGGALDGRSDLYSLGLAAWEALTGQRPWDGESLYNVIHKQKFEQLPPIEALRPGVPRRLQYVVERMLQKRPAARWAGAEGLLAQLGHPVLPADYTRWQRALGLRVQHYLNLEAERAAERPAAVATMPLASASTMQFTPGTSPAANATPGPAPADRSLAVGDVFRAWVPGHHACGAASSAQPTVAFPATDGLPPPGTTVDLQDTPALDSNNHADIPAPIYADAIEPSWDRSVDHAALRVPGRPRRTVLAAAALSVAAAGGALASDRLPGSTFGMLGAGMNASPLGSTPHMVDETSSRETTDRGATLPANRFRPLRAGVLPAIAAGARHTCALTAAEQVHCWGANDRGQLGDGGLLSRHASPVAVAGVLSFTAIANGTAHSCALTRLGDVYCWGANAHGQLGDATSVPRNAPVRVAGPATYAAITTGSAHSCALTSDGAVRCWGANDQGQLGTNLRESRLIPTTVRIARPVAQVVAGGQHTCAVTDAGQLFCWGANADGQLGTSTSGKSSSTPQPVPLRGQVVALGLGYAHTCAATAEGALWCW